MDNLSVLICTLNDRITTVPRALLSEREGICYIVSFQYTDEMFLGMIPDELRQRDDVTLLTFPSVGLSVNRNNALSSCRTPLAVIFDDDTPFTLELLESIIAEFKINEELDILVFGDNRLAFRMSTRTPRFDTRFGIGSEYLSCGEEEVLLHQSKIFGLHILHKEFNCFALKRNEWELTSSDKRVRRSWGALQYMKHSTAVSFFNIVAKALTVRLDDNGKSSLQRRWIIFRDMFDGLKYILAHPLNDSVAEEIPLDFQPIDIWRMP